MQKEYQNEEQCFLFVFYEIYQILHSEGISSGTKYQIRKFR